MSFISLLIMLDKIIYNQIVLIPQCQLILFIRIGRKLAYKTRIKGNICESYLFSELS